MGERSNSKIIIFVEIYLLSPILCLIINKLLLAKYFEIDINVRKRDGKLRIKLKNTFFS